MAEPIADPSVRRPTMLARLIAGAIRLYQLLFSSWMAPSCRFVPSCSEYAAAAVQTHGAWRGSWLALRRLARCHPLGGSGLDEVPARDCSGHHHQHTTHS